MDNKLSPDLRSRLFPQFIPPVLAAVLSFASFASPLRAQNPEMKKRVDQMEKAAAMSILARASMTWVETITTSVKGDQKNVERFQVRIGPGGKPQKTLLDQPAPPESQGSKKGNGAKKKDEYADYTEQMKALALQYLPPDADLLEKSYASGGVTTGDSDTPETFQVTFRNYIKPQDSMTLVMERAGLRLVQAQIVSYLSKRKDGVTLLVNFSQVSDGSNQLSKIVVNGKQKQLAISVEHSNYQPI
jgi:hypothetical protein